MREQSFRDSAETATMRAMPTPQRAAQLMRRLPRKVVVLLRQLGKMADEAGIQLYLVGGVVRDLLLKRENWDLDLTVEGDGIAFARLVADRYGAGMASFERFATARLTCSNGLKVDIASTRSESYVKPAALPNVQPAALQADLYRRDFTINAMAIQLNAGQFGLLHDPFGGARDLRAGILRVLHEGSFRDDPTRMFRAVRFLQRFGFQLEPKTRRLLFEAAALNMIRRLSGPRLCNEVLLLFGERHPERAIDLLARLKLLRFLHPRIRYAGMTKRLVASVPFAVAWWEKERFAPSADRPLVYLMALLSDTGLSEARSVAKRLQLSSAQSRAAELAGQSTSRISDILSRRESVSPSRAYRLLTDLPAEALVLTAVKSHVWYGREGWVRCRQRLARYLKRDRFTKIAVGGKDLVDLGLKPGPIYKRVLDRLVDAKLDGALPSEAAEREMAVHLAHRAIARSSRL